MSAHCCERSIEILIIAHIGKNMKKCDDRIKLLAEIGCADVADSKLQTIAQNLR